MPRKIRRRRREGNETAPELALPSSHSHEQMLRDLHKLMSEREFSSEAEMRAYLDSLMGNGLAKAMAGRPRDDHERAQELAYQAMDARSPQETMTLAREALKLDPDCVDALRIMAVFESASRQGYTENLFRTVEVAERLLGKEFFEENVGRFWGILETRPYMRARLDLAESLLQEGRTAEAVTHLEDMLRLNPNDNQGCRDLLMGAYLMLGRIDGAGSLLKEYERDTSAIFQWGRTLERYLSLDLKRAVAALHKARKDNPHVEGYLTGKKPMPRYLPEFYSPGDENEAIHCAANIGPAWQQHPAALDWLKTA